MSTLRVGDIGKLLQWDNGSYLVVQNVEPDIRDMCVITQSDIFRDESVENAAARLILLCVQKNPQLLQDALKRCGAAIERPGDDECAATRVLDELKEYIEAKRINHKIFTANSKVLARHMHKSTLRFMSSRPDLNKPKPYETNEL